MASGSGDPRWLNGLNGARGVLEEAKRSDLGFPINIGAVLGFFGLGHPIIDFGKSRHGGLRRVDNRWQPVVYRSHFLSGPLSVRERFTVIHEIGHALVEDRVSLHPKRNREYWQLEAECDRFAGDLLVPQAQVDIAATTISSAPSLLLGIEGLARRSSASRPVVARRLTEQCKAAGAVSVRRIVRGSDRSSRLRVEWLFGNDVTSGMRSRQYIPEHSFLHEVVTRTCSSDLNDFDFDADKSITCRRVAESQWLVTSWHQDHVALGQQQLPID